MRHVATAVASLVVTFATQAGAQGSVGRAATGAPAAAQDTTARREVLGVVQQLFDAMRARDTAKMRSLFDTGATLVAAGARGGGPGMQRMPVSQFVTAIAGAPAGRVLDERTYAPEVRVDANLATVWTEYDFYVGDQFSHCGVDAFQLARTAAGWKIVALADTRRREGCPSRGGAGNRE
jgi:hypothetical protein